MRPDDRRPLTLPRFLTARLNDDEAAARAAYDWLTMSNDEGEVGTRWATSRGYEHNLLTTPGYVFQRGWSPERVLAEVAAKRALVKMATRALKERDSWSGYAPQTAVEAAHAFEQVLDALAAVYADHPDYPEVTP